MGKSSNLKFWGMAEDLPVPEGTAGSSAGHQNDPDWTSESSGALKIKKDQNDARSAPVLSV
jgi:hypothetical protein